MNKYEETESHNVLRVRNDIQTLLVRSESVTHVISENNCGADVRTWLEAQGGGQRSGVHLLDISWYTESMRAGHPVAITDRHKPQVHLCFTHPA